MKKIKFILILITIFMSMFLALPINAYSSVTEHALAQLIEDAVGNQPYLAKVAFGAMIINRSESGRFSPSVIDVINQYRTLNPKVNHGYNKITFQSQSAAADAFRSDPSEGALYCNIKVNVPSYAVITLKIGDCIFWK